MENMFTIYGKPGCAGCEQAKAMLDQKGIGYLYVDIMKSPKAMQLFRERGFRGVPQIFRGEDHIGSATELQQLLTQDA